MRTNTPALQRIQRQLEGLKAALDRDTPHEIRQDLERALYATGRLAARGVAMGGHLLG